MTEAKKKADELIKKYKPLFKDWAEWYQIDLSKQCALTCIDEIMIESKKYDFGHPVLLSNRLHFLEQVKAELKKKS